MVAVLHTPEDGRIQYREQAEKEGIASVLSVPLMLGEGILGVIRAYTAEPRHFDLDDRLFVEGIANLAGIALENAKLYETLKKDYKTFRREMLEDHPLRDW